jgi:leucyl-tRNA synthetase
MSEQAEEETLMNYRIAYLGETMVNWCAGLGTVLANDEVVDGVSVRGGFPVVQKKMSQWCLRVSAYAQRLLDGLDTIDWSDSHQGHPAQLDWTRKVPRWSFEVKDSDVQFTIFTTRADTMFGVTFMVLAPESEYVSQVTTPLSSSRSHYINYVKKRTERERMIRPQGHGCVQRLVCHQPLHGRRHPHLDFEYVLAGYGTGAIMAVPAHDSRDYAFAKPFQPAHHPAHRGCRRLRGELRRQGGHRDELAASGTRQRRRIQSQRLTVKEAIAATKKYVTEKGIGRVKVNYRLRDAIFSASATGASRSRSTIKRACLTCSRRPPCRCCCPR